MFPSTIPLPTYSSLLNPIPLNSPMKIQTTVFNLGLCLIGLGLVAAPGMAEGGTCVAESSCFSQRIQFTPGEFINVKVANHTSGLIRLEYIQGGDPIVINPGEEYPFLWGNTGDFNMSLVIWDETEVPLSFQPIQVNDRQLLLEIYPYYETPGDRAIYLKDDGQLDIL